MTENVCMTILNHTLALLLRITNDNFGHKTCKLVCGDKRMLKWFLIFELSEFMIVLALCQELCLTSYEVNLVLTNCSAKITFVICGLKFEGLTIWYRRLSISTNFEKGCRLNMVAHIFTNARAGSAKT